MRSSRATPSTLRLAAVLVAALAWAAPLCAEGVRLVPVHPRGADATSVPLPVEHVLEVGTTTWLAAGPCGLYRKSGGDVLDPVPAQGAAGTHQPCTDVGYHQAYDTTYFTKLAHTDDHTLAGAHGRVIAVATDGLYAADGKTFAPFQVVATSGEPITGVEHIAFNTKGLWLGTTGGAYHLSTDGDRATRLLEGYVTFLGMVSGKLYAGTYEDLWVYESGGFRPLVSGTQLPAIVQVLSAPIGLVALNRRTSEFATAYQIQNDAVVLSTPYVAAAGATTDGLLLAFGNTTYIQRENEVPIALELEFFPPNGPVKLLGDFGGYRLIGTGTLLTRMSGPRSKLIHVWHTDSDWKLDKATPTQRGVLLWGTAGLYRLDETMTVSATTNTFRFLGREVALFGLRVTSVALSDNLTPDIVAEELERFGTIQTTTREDLEKRMLEGDFRPPDEEIVRDLSSDRVHRAIRDTDGNVAELPTLRSVVVVPAKRFWTVAGLVGLILLLALLYWRRPRAFIRFSFWIRSWPFNKAKVTAATPGMLRAFGNRYRKFLKIEGSNLPRHSIGLDAEIANVPASDTVADEVESSVVTIAKREALLPVTIHIQSTGDLTQAKLREAATERLKSRLRLEEGEFFDSLYTHARYWFLIRPLEGPGTAGRSIKEAMSLAQAAGHRYTIIRHKKPPEPFNAEIDFPHPPEV